MQSRRRWELVLRLGRRPPRAGFFRRFFPQRPCGACWNLFPVSAVGRLRSARGGGVARQPRSRLCSRFHRPRGGSRRAKTASKTGRAAAEAAPSPDLRRTVLYRSSPGSKASCRRSSNRSSRFRAVPLVTLTPLPGGTRIMTTGSARSLFVPVASAGDTTRPYACINMGAN